MRKLHLLAVLIILAVPVGASAQSDQTLRGAQEIFDTVMSPYCPGRTLSGCPSDKARELRDDILRRIDQGETPLEVKESLLRQFGPDLAGMPQNKGAGILGWLVPLLFVVLCLIIVAITLKRSKKSGATPPKSNKTSNRTGAGQTGLEKDIEQELKSRLMS